MAYTTIDDSSAHFQVKYWAGNDTQDTPQPLASFAALEIVALV